MIAPKRIDEKAIILFEIPTGVNGTTNQIPHRNATKTMVFIFKMDTLSLIMFHFETGIPFSILYKVPCGNSGETL